MTTQSVDSPSARSADGLATGTNHLLHIDSSIQGDRSVSRRLTARAAGVWLAAHPGGTVSYRDLGADPIPHLDSDGGLARMVAPAAHTPAQAAPVAPPKHPVRQ